MPGQEAEGCQAGSEARESRRARAQCDVAAESESVVAAQPEHRHGAEPDSTPASPLRRPRRATEGRYQTPAINIAIPRAATQPEL